MPIDFINLKKLVSETRDETNKKISQILDQASFIGGEEVERFAGEFGAYLGGALCAPVANGTDALILALKAFGIGPGDEVITVPTTFIATSEAITAVGALVRFVDVDPKNYTMDPALLQKAIGPKAKAVIPVHLYGQPADMDPIMEIAKKHGLKVIEDAAQAHGAEYKGRKAGALGDAACFSFYPTKNLGAIGDAGAVVSKDASFIKKVAQIANHGRAEHYYHEVEGLNSRMDAFQAGVLRIRLTRLDSWNDRRRSIAEAYNKAIVPHKYLEHPHIEPFAKHVFHLYCVQTPFRDSLITYLKDRKIGHGVYYPLPLHLQPAYSYLGYKKGDFPISERISERILALALHPGMSDSDVSDVCLALKSFVPK